jgi:hypothetical protein
MQQFRIARERRRTQRPVHIAPLDTGPSTTVMGELDELLDRIEWLLRGVT